MQVVSNHGQVLQDVSLTAEVAAAEAYHHVLRGLIQRVPHEKGGLRDKALRSSRVQKESKGQEVREQVSSQHLLHLLLLCDI